MEKQSRILVPVIADHRQCNENDRNRGIWPNISCRSGRSIAATHGAFGAFISTQTIDGMAPFFGSTFLRGPKVPRRCGHPTNEATTFSHFGHFKSGRGNARGWREGEGRSRNFTPSSKRAHVVSDGRGCKVNCQRTVGRKTEQFPEPLSSIAIAVTTFCASRDVFLCQENEDRLFLPVPSDCYLPAHALRCDATEI